MDNKKLGMVLILISISFLIAIIIFKIQVDNLTEALMIETGGSCIQNGECLHETSNVPVYTGGSLAFITLALGIYLILFEKSQQYAEKTHKEIVSTLEKTKKEQDSEEKFNFLLKALDEDEKKVMNAIKEQDGIEQATLRIRTDLSKTKLSVTLSNLEKKNLVKKIPQGKKNRVYIKNAF